MLPTCSRLIDQPSDDQETSRADSCSRTHEPTKAGEYVESRLAEMCVKSSEGAEVSPA